MAPQVGLEPTTTRLTAECSAIELLRNIGKRSISTPLSFGIRRRPTLPGRVQPSTIGAEGLNFCVRYGNRWYPFAIITGNCELVFFPHTLTTAQHFFDLNFLSLFPISLSDFASKSSPRPISISKLTHYYAYTADLSPGSLPGVLLSYRDGSLILEVGFTLRCLQRLSHPYAAIRLCSWRNNRCTGGMSIPVLSY